MEWFLEKVAEQEEEAPATTAEDMVDTRMLRRRERVRERVS